MNNLNYENIYHTLISFVFNRHINFNLVSMNIMNLKTYKRPDEFSRNFI